MLRACVCASEREKTGYLLLIKGLNTQTLDMGPSNLLFEISMGPPPFRDEKGSKTELGLALSRRPLNPDVFHSIKGGWAEETESRLKVFMDERKKTIGSWIKTWDNKRRIWENDLNTNTESPAGKRCKNNEIITAKFQKVLSSVNEISILAAHEEKLLSQCGSVSDDWLESYQANQNKQIAAIQRVNQSAFSVHQAIQARYSSGEMRLIPGLGVEDGEMSENTAEKNGNLQNPDATGAPKTAPSKQNIAGKPPPPRPKTKTPVPALAQSEKPPRRQNSPVPKGNIDKSPQQAQSGSLAEDQLLPISVSPRKNPSTITATPGQPTHPSNLQIPTAPKPAQQTNTQDSGEMVATSTPNTQGNVNPEISIAIKTDYGAIDEASANNTTPIAVKRAGSDSENTDPKKQKKRRAESHTSDDDGSIAYADCPIHVGQSRFPERTKLKYICDCETHALRCKMCKKDSHSLHFNCKSEKLSDFRNRARKAVREVAEKKAKLENQRDDVRQHLEQTRMAMAQQCIRERDRRIKEMTEQIHREAQAQIAWMDRKLEKERVATEAKAQGQLANMTTITREISSHMQTWPPTQETARMLCGHMSRASRFETTELPKEFSFQWVHVIPDEPVKMEVGEEESEDSESSSDEPE